MRRIFRQWAQKFKKYFPFQPLIFQVISENLNIIFAIIETLA